MFWKRLKGRCPVDKVKRIFSNVEACAWIVVTCLFLALLLNTLPTSLGTDYSPSPKNPIIYKNTKIADGYSEKPMVKLNGKSPDKLPYDKDLYF